MYTTIRGVRSGPRTGMAVTADEGSHEDNVCQINTQGRECIDIDNCDTHNELVSLKS